MNNGTSNKNHNLKVVGVGGTLREKSSSLFVLKQALKAAKMAGADTQLFDVRKLDLPLFVPGRPLVSYGAEVAHFIEEVRKADAMLWSTAAYHGTLAGVTKNFIDFFQHLSGDEKPYLQGKVVGLIATAGGDLAAVNAANAMVHAVHSLRGTAAPLLVAIPNAWRAINPEEGFIHEKWAERLDQLGRLVVKTAAALEVESKSGQI